MLSRRLIRRGESEINLDYASWEAPRKQSTKKWQARLSQSSWPCEGRGAPSFVPKLMLAKAGSEGARHPRDARHNGGIAGKKVGGSLPWATDVLRFSWHVAFPAAY